MKELSQKKVVFFGDAYPGHITYALNVIGFLNSWLDSVESRHDDNDLPLDVILALEIDNVTLNELEVYLKTGENYSLLRHLIDEQVRYNSDKYRSRSLSVDCLRFYHELNHVRRRIDLMNLRFMDQPISLRIIGIDPKTPFDDRSIQGLGRSALWERMSEWEKSERGRQSSGRLMKWIEENPRTRMLVFCQTKLLTRETEYGMSVVYLLDSLIGRSNVTVFQNSRMPRNITPGSILASPGNEMEEYIEDSSGPDFIIRQGVTPPHPLPIFLVKSENVLRSLIDLSEYYATSQDTLEKNISRELLSLVLEQLMRSHLVFQPSQRQYLSSLQYFVGVSGHRAIFTSTIYDNLRRLFIKFDAVQDVLSVDEVLATITPSTEFLNGIAVILENTPPWISRDGSSTSIHGPTVSMQIGSPGWARIWKEREVERTVYMLMQLFWLGTPEEVTKAMKALQTTTGNKFDTCREWEDWWHRIEVSKQ